jgi:hypothetical protein
MGADVLEQFLLWIFSLFEALRAHALEGKVFGFTEINVFAFRTGKIFVAY